MLEIPTKGFAISVDAHNIELDSMCDWIEGCAMFSTDSVSVSDIVDCLFEDNIYRSQDYAKEFVSDALTELSRRTRCLGGSAPYSVASATVNRQCDWQDVPAFAFCLMLSLQVLYRSHFHREFGRNYTDQGLLFERLTVASLTKLGWTTYLTGWSKKSCRSIRDQVAALAGHLGEASRSEGLDRWSTVQAKDGGLDVVCHLAFADGWSGRPVLYMQCASGENWRDKRATPNLDLWEKLLDLATRPRRGISIPFALLADDFRKAANYDALYLLLDRHRLCAPSPDIAPDWLPRDLVIELNNWTASRIAALPLANASTAF